jgi:hypothetical protein
MSKFKDFLRSLRNRNEIINISPPSEVRKKNKFQLRFEKFKLQFRIGNLERERKLLQDDLHRLYRKGGPVERIIVGSLMLLLGIYLGATSIINQTKIEIWAYLFIFVGISIILYGSSDLRAQKRFKGRIRKLDDEIAGLKSTNNN